MSASAASSRVRRQARQGARVRSQLKGVAGTRKLLRQLPTSVKQEMGDILAGYGPELLAAAVADAPSRTGALKAGLSFKLLRASLRLRVGILGKRLAGALFYGRIVEFGRKGKDVMIKRGPRAGHRMRIKEMPARHFVFTKRPELRARLNRSLAGFWTDSLALAAQGAASDD